MFEELLIRFGLTREKLTPDELHTLDSWAKSLSVQKITVADVEEFVRTMIDTLERELVGYETPASFVAYLFRRSRRRHVEARLENLLMLRDFLTQPARAMKFVEKRMEGLKHQIGQ